MKMLMQPKIYWCIWGSSCHVLAKHFFPLYVLIFDCGSFYGYAKSAWWHKTIAFGKHFLDASSAYCMCTFLFYLSLLCLLCFLFFFPSPHAVPKRALQRDKYGSQTKHCLSNVIDFGFTFFSLNSDKGVMKTKCHSLWK